MSEKNKKLFGSDEAVQFLIQNMDSFETIIHGNISKPEPKVLASVEEAVFRSNHILDLWEEFGDIPMDPETECLCAAWNHFPVGTFREEIWHWFEEEFSISVADLMYGKLRADRDEWKKVLKNKRMKEKRRKNENRRRIC